MAEEKTWKYMVYQCQTMKPMLKSKTRCCKFSKRIGTTITKDAIDAAHRLKGKPKTDQNKKCPSIIVLSYS